MVKKDKAPDRRPPPLNSKEPPRTPARDNPQDATKIDLGDDLLVTAEIQREYISSSSRVESAEDQLATAKILLNEGLVEDAKKTLRKILIIDPDHQAARFTLKEILDNELKELLTGKEPMTRKPRAFERFGKEARAPEPTSEEAVRELEEAIGSEPARRDTQNTPIIAQESIKDLTAGDRVDIGIAFMEMGAYDKAAEIFLTALHFIDPSTPEGRGQHNATNVLLARAFLDSGRSFEAIQILHPLVRSDEIAVEEKVEFFYLMGIAHEMRNERKVALAWYSKVRDIDPHFRDIRDRIRKPFGKKST